MPYKNRKSLKSKDDTVRELIFKSYVIPYKIEDNEIWILGIFNHNLWEL
jgi:hypothetical protein